MTFAVVLLLGSKSLPPVKKYKHPFKLRRSSLTSGFALGEISDLALYTYFKAKMWAISSDTHQLHYIPKHLFIL